MLEQSQFSKLGHWAHFRKQQRQQRQRKKPKRHMKAQSRSKRKSSKPKLYPCWVKCEYCEDYTCTLHGGHVASCDCPGIDSWAKAGVIPYVNKEKT